MTDEPSANVPAVIEPLAPAVETRTQVKLAKLAREVAMNIRDLPVVLKDYGLTADDYNTHIYPNPFYRRTLDNYIQEWNSAVSTQQRIKVEAAATLEDSLHHLGARMNKNDENLPAVVEAAKLFAKLAGVDGQAATGGGSAEKFSITINLGADTQLHYERDITPTPPIDETPVLSKPKDVSDDSESPIS